MLSRLILQTMLERLQRRRATSGPDDSLDDAIRKTIGLLNSCCDHPDDKRWFFVRAQPLNPLYASHPTVRQVRALRKIITEGRWEKFWIPELAVDQRKAMSAMKANEVGTLEDCAQTDCAAGCLDHNAFVIGHSIPDRAPSFFTVCTSCDRIHPFSLVADE